MSEEKKDVLETVAAGAIAGVAAATGAATAVVVAAAPTAIAAVWMRFQKRRADKWWTDVTERARDPEALRASIENGLATEDEYIVAGVVGGARAASSAIDLSAVPVIAELSRRYFQERDLPRWFYRGALELLERVDAPELGALRQLFVEIKDIRSDSITMLGDTEGDLSWRAFQTSVTDPWQQLTPFPKPARLFGYIKRAGLGFDSGGFGISGSPKVLVADREPADWLREALVSGIAS